MKPSRKDYLLMIARHGTALHVEELVRKFRSVERTEERARADKQHESRELSWYYDDDGLLVIHARLPAEQGELVLKALEAAREALYQESLDEAEERLQNRLMAMSGCSAEHSADAEEIEAARPAATEPGRAQRADALVVLAETQLAHEPAALNGGDRYQVTVHIDAAVLENPEAAGRCEVENGPWLASDTARRLSCDSSVVRLVESEDGTPLDVGRKTRSIPPALRRALRSRDGGCRFPGCSQKQWVDGHHVKHWAEGGETRLDNLILLCRFHHRLVHEGGFGLSVGVEGQFLFSRPDGQRLPNAPVEKINGNLAKLVRLHERLGLTIDADTCVTQWEGEKMDWGMAIDGLVYRPAIERQQYYGNG